MLKEDKLLGVCTQIHRTGIYLNSGKLHKFLASCLYKGDFLPDVFQRTAIFLKLD